jgi:iron complex outermembrane receptor protein
LFAPLRLFIILLFYFSMFSRLLTIIQLMAGIGPLATYGQTDTIKPSVPSEVTLKEVHITGHSRPVSNTSVSAALSGTELAKSSGAALGDVLRSVSGVNVLKTGATIAKPVIHGLHSNRLLILNNGIRLEGQAWGAEHAPEIDPMLAENMYVIKGAESVRYGAEAIGGVILVQPPALPVAPGVSGRINLVGASNGRMATSSGMLSGGLTALPGFGWRVQGTYKKGGNIKTPGYYLGNTGLREMNYSAAVGYTTGSALYEAYYSQFSTSLGVLYSAHVSTSEDIKARIAAGSPTENYGFTYDLTAPRQEIFHHLLKLKAHYDLTSTRSLNMVYGFQKNLRKEFDFRRGDREALPITDLALTTHTLDVSTENKVANGTKTLYGFNGIAQVNNNIPGTLANTFIPNYESFTGGLYAIRHWSRRYWDLEAGLRYDFKFFDAAGFRYLSGSDINGNPASGPAGQYYGGQSQFHNVTGTLAAFWRIDSLWRIGGNLGLAWRAPSANELFSNGIHHGAGLYEIGDPDMKTERGYKWIGSVKYASAQLSFELNPFVQYLDNYVYSKPELRFIQTIRGTYPVFRYAQANALFLGLDLSGSYKFADRFTYRANLSILRARDLEADRYLPFIPPDRLDHSLSLDIKANCLPSGYLLLGHTYTARQHRYEAGTDYAEPPAAYHLFNAVAGTTINMGKQELGIQLSVDNLLNVRYKDYMNRYRYFAHDMGRTITLRINYKF